MKSSSWRSQRNCEPGQDKKLKANKSESKGPVMWGLDDIVNLKLVNGAENTTKPKKQSK